MNWVSPIKDEATLQQFKQLLKENDDKYYIMFEIGIGTGLQLQDILKLKVKDLRSKDTFYFTIGSKNIQRTYKLPEDLKQIIQNYIKDKNDESFLFTGHNSSPQPLSREQAYRIFKATGKAIGLNSIGAQTMRKTFAWRYFKETGDIIYLQTLFNHASPSITYRYIGEKPSVEVVLKKMTPEENERSRKLLYTNDSGKKRIRSILETLSQIESELNNPANNDAFYGKVDCLLTELEELMSNYKNS